MAQKGVLGKGLASLLPSAAMGQGAAPQADAAVGSPASPAAVPPVATGASDGQRHMGIALAGIDDIVVNTYQPRRDFDEAAISELAQSIRSNGIIQPLVVRRTDQGLMLIAGERRLRAARQAGLKQVPIVIRKSTDREALEIALIENIQRQDLGCIDEALAYFQLLQDFSLTQEEIATRVGKDRATVANYLRLLRLPEAIIDDLKRRILSFGHGKALLSVEDNDIRLRARAIIVEKRLSVRDAEALVEALKKGEEPPAPTGAKNSTAPLSAVAQRFFSIAQDLTRKWGTRVEFKGGERKGKIIVHYTSRQELDRLLSSMQN